MLKYIKYYMPGFTGILFILFFLLGENFPTFFLLYFSLLIIIGDIVFPKDKYIQKFSYPSLLNLSIYINLPILFFLVILVISLLSENLSVWYLYNLNLYFNIDIIAISDSYHLLDKISLIIQTVLSIGMLGTVPGHELTHRKKDKFDMFFGNWLLAFSWDCTFAIEHVYGHHKNVCLPSDPASAKRGENIYIFILKAIYKEQIVGFQIESNRLKRKGFNHFMQNKMIIGYFRSFALSCMFFFIGGTQGIIYFMLLAFLAKSLLEAINYIEHYGLVREKGKPVCMRHSWNSNHFMSSIFLCNVTRHSDHHRASSLKFWELNPNDKDAPMLPYGYLSMLYIVLFFPFLYKKIMKKKIIDWDLNFANETEKNIVSIY